MPASLSQLLIFQVASRGPRAIQLSNGSLDIEGAPPTRIGIDQQRQRSRASHSANILTYIVQCRYAEIRQPKRRVRHPGPRQVKRPEPRSFGQESTVSVDRTNELQRD